MYSKEWLQETGQPLPYNYSNLYNALYGNIGSLHELSKELTDPSFWNSITKLNDVSSYFDKIFIYPMYINTPNFEGRVLKLVGAIDDTYTNIRVYPLYTAPPSTNIGVYTLFEERINEKYNDFRDYGSYTKLKLYLPYLGFVDLDTNEVMDNMLKVCLQVDFRTGYGLYYIMVGTTDNSFQGSYFNYKILTKHSVKLAIEIPVGSTSSAEQTRNMVLSAVKIAASVGFAVAGMPTASVASASSAFVKTENFSEAKARADAPGSRLKTVSTTSNVSTSERDTSREYVYTRGSYSIGMDVVNSAVSALNGSSAQLTSTESNDPVLEGVGCKYVKLVIERPIYGEVGNYYNLCGRPLQEVKQLDLLSGYTEISDFHLEGFTDATYSELAELNSLLKSGIIL